MQYQLDSQADTLQTALERQPWCPAGTTAGVSPKPHLRCKAWWDREVCLGHRIHTQCVCCCCPRLGSRTAARAVLVQRQHADSNSRGDGCHPVIHKEDLEVLAVLEGLDLQRGIHALDRVSKWLPAACKGPKNIGHSTNTQNRGGRGQVNLQQLDVSQQAACGRYVAALWPRCTGAWHQK